MTSRVWMTAAGSGRRQREREVICWKLRAWPLVCLWGMTRGWQETRGPGRGWWHGHRARIGRLTAERGPAMGHMGPVTTEICWGLKFYFSTGRTGCLRMSVSQWREKINLPVIRICWGGGEEGGDWLNLIAGTDTETLIIRGMSC